VDTKIEALITPKTKVIVPVHYAGMACDMDKIMALAEKYNLLVVEDAAQAIDSFYKPLPPSPLKGEQDTRYTNALQLNNPTKTPPLGGRGAGTIGHFAAFSFHETKNIMSGALLGYLRNVLSICPANKCLQSESFNLSNTKHAR
jgi:dTDP-4-amino-4,6-dideoxygalactose transaminase